VLSWLNIGGHMRRRGSKHGAMDARAKHDIRVAQRRFAAHAAPLKLLRDQRAGFAMGKQRMRWRARVSIESSARTNWR